MRPRFACRVLDLGFWGSWYAIFKGLGFRIWDFGVPGLGFRFRIVDSDCFGSTLRRKPLSLDPRVTALQPCRP